MLNKFNLKMLLVYLGKLIWDLYLELALGFQEWGHRWDPKWGEGRKYYIWEINLLQCISSWGKGRTTPWQQGSKGRGSTRSSRRAQLIKFFFFRLKMRLLKCNYSFLEGLSMLEVTSVKTSLKWTFRKFLLGVCTDCQKTSLLVWCPSASYTNCYILCNFGDYQCPHIDSVFVCFDWKMCFLPNNWEHFVWKLPETFWVLCYKAHLHIFVENLFVVTPGLAVVSVGFLACFLLLSLPYVLEKITERGLWNLHNHHSDIYQSVNLRTFPWVSG